MCSEPYGDEQGFDYELQHTRTTILMLSNSLARQEHHSLCLTSIKHCSQGNRQHLVAMPTADILLYEIKREWPQKDEFSRKNNHIQYHTVSHGDQILRSCMWMMERFKMPHTCRTDEPDSENDSCRSPLTQPTCEVPRTDLVSAGI